MKKKLKCILLIDDDEADNFFHENTIQKANCTEEVVTSEDGQEALDYLKASLNQEVSKPELIFLDINMPGMNGWEFLEEYKRLGYHKEPWSILCMLTTSLNPDDIDSAKKDALIADFISKPLTEKNLLKVLMQFFPDRF